jgi:hypothetical protein
MRDESRHAAVPVSTTMMPDEGLTGRAFRFLQLKFGTSGFLFNLEFRINKRKQGGIVYLGHSCSKGSNPAVMPRTADKPVWLVEVVFRDDGGFASHHLMSAGTNKLSFYGIKQPSWSLLTVRPKNTWFCCSCSPEKISIDAYLIEQNAISSRKDVLPEC